MRRLGMPNPPPLPGLPWPGPRRLSFALAGGPEGGVAGGADGVAGASVATAAGAGGGVAGLVLSASLMADLGERIGLSMIWGNQTENHVRMPIYGGMRDEKAED